jgi:hypothetical protein
MTLVRLRLLCSTSCLSLLKLCHASWHFVGGAVNEIREFTFGDEKFILKTASHTFALQIFMHS